MRLDLALVARGLVESRAQAQAAIKAGGVQVDGHKVLKASMQVGPDQTLTAQKAHPYVSRGGLKLSHGLAKFEVSVEGKTCLDIGASTGGFTDVLLRQGALKVFAVDVGRDQLHARLRTDPRVVNLEATDARELTEIIIPDQAEILVCDASFIMLERLLERPLSLTKENGEGVVLFKPQFQVGPENVGRGGIVKDMTAIKKAKECFVQWARQTGWQVVNETSSPIQGGDGNREYLLHIKCV